MSEQKSAIPGPDYARLLAEVKERVRSAQYAALKAVNTELVGLYWDIGRMIVERQAGATWGKAIVQHLSEDLQREFPGVGGFSASNLWRMKSFFEMYRDVEKLAPLVREIGWSHNIVIMERCSDPLEREFYIRMTRKFGWSKNVLIHFRFSGTRRGTQRKGAGTGADRPDRGLPADDGRHVRLHGQSVPTRD